MALELQRCAGRVSGGCLRLATRAETHEVQEVDPVEWRLREEMEEEEENWRRAGP